MLAKRRLALASSDVLLDTILRREDLADIQLAEEVLGNARQHAAQILADARDQAQRETDAALAEFWAKANGALDALEQERQGLQQEAVNAVEDLLNTALSRLLDETTLAERTRALIRNLADSQRHEAVATLSTHPDQLDELRNWLAQSRFSEHWQLKSDPLMPPLTLRLSDANGTFDIDWMSVRRGLLGHET